jgi:flavin reductase (DIM6/NTAB) family NADH-FMN oxidoreductase RutF
MNELTEFAVRSVNDQCRTRDGLLSRASHGPLRIDLLIPIPLCQSYCNKKSGLVLGATMPIDSRELRNALGRFATGVAIITTLDREEGPLGLTVNSFSAVSVDPALILWSLRRSAPSFSYFLRNGFFAVNVLSAEQRVLSEVFSRPGDKFSEVNWTRGLGGSPLIDRSLSRFECRHINSFPGGDHVVFVGTVERFVYEEGTPLLFFGGQYHQLARMSAV